MTTFKKPVQAINLIFNLFLLTYLVGGCCTAKNEANKSFKNEAGFNDACYRTIADRNATVEEARLALRLLDSIREAPQFWTDIANDESYAVERRRQAIEQLFYRHIRAGMTLGEVANIIHKPNWLLDKDIHPLSIIAGHIPINFAPGDTIVVLLILPPITGSNVGIYLGISGKMDVTKLGGVLRGEKTTPEITRSRIMEIGLSHK